MSCRGNNNRGTIRVLGHDTPTQYPPALLQEEDVLEANLGEVVGHGGTYHSRPTHHHLGNIRKFPLILCQASFPGTSRCKCSTFCEEHRQDEIEQAGLCVGVKIIWLRC